MQQYPNFYQNPQMSQQNMGMYQNFNQPMGNPYMDRVNQLQQFQQSLQQPVQQNQPQGIIGRIVNDFSEITANDVPMDGTGAFFFKQDGSEIQHRLWNATNGSIVKTSYMPILDQNQVEGTNIPQTDFNALNDGITALGSSIMARIDKLEESFANLEINQNGSKAKITASRAKKGADEE